MIAGMTYYQILWYFILFSFFGWVIEVIYHAMKLGKIINRGFLNGPICPVYGFGVLAVFALVKTALPSLETASGLTVTSEESWLGTLIIFVGGMILTTLIELIAGFLLDVAFHTRWWDYSNEPLNFHGYICLRFSFIWGLAVLLVVRVGLPILEAEGTVSIPERYGWWVLLALYLLLLTDFIVSVLTAVGLNKKLEELDKIRSDMRVVSDKLSDTIGESTLKTQKLVEDTREKISGKKAALNSAAESSREELEKKKAFFEARKAALHQSLTKKVPFGFRRLLTAFPAMRSHAHDESLQDVLEDIKAS